MIKRRMEVIGVVVAFLRLSFHALIFFFFFTRRMHWHLMMFSFFSLLLSGSLSASVDSMLIHV